MDTIILIILSLLLLAVFVPSMFFLVECWLSILDGSKSRKSLPERNVSSIFLIPAHDEQEVIETTLRQLLAGIDVIQDFIVVVADNCSDDTQKIAEGFSNDYPVCVINREDPSNRGKGFALDFGREFIRENFFDSDVVIVFDADCGTDASSISNLKKTVFDSQSVVQSCYLIKDKSGSPAKKISEFAFLVKNRVRLKGLSRICKNIPITGSGIGFPMSDFIELNLGGSHVVEDMLLGVDLAEKKQPVLYCDDSIVLSYFPESKDAQKTQEDRWEQGHLSIMRDHILRLLCQSVKDRNIGLLIFSLDMLIPPLTMLVGANLLFVVIALVYFLFSGYAFFLQMGVVVNAAVYLGVFSSWLFFGREVVGVVDFVKLPLFIFSKVRMYLRLGGGQSKGQWIKTKRD